MNKYYPFEHEFNLEYALHDCKLVFDSIQDDESFQKCDSGLVLGYANEIMYALEFALTEKDKVREQLVEHIDHLISDISTKPGLSQDFKDGVEAGYYRVKSDLRWLLPASHDQDTRPCHTSEQISVGDAIHYSCKNENLYGVVTRVDKPTAFFHHITVLTSKGYTVTLDRYKGEWHKTGTHHTNIEEICKHDNL